MTDIVTHITVNGDKKLREMTDAAYQRGLRDGYSSRVKDEVEARKRGTRVTQWSCALCDDGTVELNMVGNRLDGGQVEEIAATLWHHLRVIRKREATR